MIRKTNDIDDNEIRIISAETSRKERKNKFIRICLPIIAVVLLVGGIIAAIILSNEPDDNQEELTPSQVEQAGAQPNILQEEVVVNDRGKVMVMDTTINNKALKIYCPEHLSPRLVIGTEYLDDPNIVFATQAADIRKDNGQIAGTFVMNGEVISKGEAKAGFCSIINGELTIGVSDATPMLEQALTEDGFFFRQYPLVVGGQAVENKPKGRAIRKALAELNGKICVIMSEERLTFHEFSQLLIGLGVRNAIYLVGSSSYGFYVNENGEKILTGLPLKTEIENLSYIVWERGKS